MGMVANCTNYQKKPDVNGSIVYCGKGTVAQSTNFSHSTTRLEALGGSCSNFSAQLPHFA